MNLSPSTRAELTENLRLVADAVETSDPGEDTALYELSQGLMRLTPTRHAEAGELAPVVTALGAPWVPREAIELLEWQARTARGSRVTITSRSDCEYNVQLGTWGLNVASVHVEAQSVSLAEAARAALEKVSR